MFWNKKEKEGGESKSVEWHKLEDLAQLDEIVKESSSQPVMIYKHSTRCGISSMALNRLERGWTSEGDNIKAYYLDLIRFREISNAVAQKFEVYHESPQVLLIKNGKAIFDESHMGISFETIIKNA